MRVVQVGKKQAVHTSIDESLMLEIAALAKRFDITKSDVINSILTLGLAAQKRHAKKYKKAKR